MSGLHLCWRQCLSRDVTPAPQLREHAVHLVHSPHQEAVASAPPSRLLDAGLLSCRETHRLGRGWNASGTRRPPWALDSTASWQPGLRARGDPGGHPRNWGPRIFPTLRSGASLGLSGVLGTYLTSPTSLSRVGPQLGSAGHAPSPSPCLLDITLRAAVSPWPVLLDGRGSKWPGLPLRGRSDRCPWQERAVGRLPGTLATQPLGHPPI